MNESWLVDDSRYGIDPRGGPLSGHHGHGGRPGRVGGSVPGGGASANGGASKLTGKPTGDTPLGDDQKGINDSVVVNFDDGSKGIFKSKAGTKYGDYRAETAAYELSESLGWGIVPCTETTAYKGRIGSMQRWIENSQTEETLGVGKAGRTAEIAFFDLLTWNDDRHHGNVIHDASGKQWAIDNGGCFGFLERGRRRFPSRAYYSYRHRNSKALQDIQEWSKTPKRKAYYNMLSKTFGKKTANAFDKNLKATIRINLEGLVP